MVVKCRYLICRTLPEDVCVLISKTLKRVPLHKKRYSNNMMDISRVTDYLYVGSRIRKEDADELKALNF